MTLPPFLQNLVDNLFGDTTDKDETWDPLGEIKSGKITSNPQNTKVGKKNRAAAVKKILNIAKSRDLQRIPEPRESHECPTMGAFLASSSNPNVYFKYGPRGMGEVYYKKEKVTFLTFGEEWKLGAILERRFNEIEQSDRENDALISNFVS